jgi:hypothetical protein
MHRGIVYRIGLAAIAGCVAVGALAFAGCGGGSSTTATGASGASGASGSTALSQSEFVSQANAACKAANAKIEALTAPPSGASITQVVPFLTQSVAANQAALTTIEGLTPPSNLQSDWNKLLADAKAKQAEAQKALDAAKANDASQFQAALKQLQATQGQDDALTRSIGLTECAKTPQPKG